MPAWQLIVTHFLLPRACTVTWFLARSGALLRYWSLAQARCDLMIDASGRRGPHLGWVIRPQAARLLQTVILGPRCGGHDPAPGGRSPGAGAGVDTSYPVTQLAVTIAMAATALPDLSRPLHRLLPAAGCGATSTYDQMT